MERVNEVKTLLQSVLTELYAARRFDDAFMLKAQRIGLQGEKRRLRYQTAKYHNLINFFRCDAFDLYGIDIAVSDKEIAVQPVTGMQDFFQKCLAHCESLYDALHGAANSLISVNARCYGSLLYGCCDCLSEVIKYYRRTLLEGNASGWRPEFLFLHQTTDCNIHDELEKKEASVGYSF